MSNKKIGKKVLASVLSAVTLTAVAAAPLQGVNTDAIAPAITADAASSDNYAKLLQYSLYFYDANMCGKGVDANCGVTWRSNCHTDDSVPGGFHDAGDHAMFGLPQGYAASTLGWAYHEFPDAFNETGQAEHLKVITDYFCEFFRNSTTLDGSGNVTNFVYQKGDGDADHAYWGAPEKQPGGRKIFSTNSGASDIAAEYAAALAANYVNFGNTEDLKYAKALYAFSKKHNSVATDGPTGFYNNKSCADEQAWAAGWLYLATKDGSYKNDCRASELGWAHAWETVNTGVACLSGEIDGNWSPVNGYLGSLTNSSNYLLMDSWGSARYNCSVQMTALIADKNTNSTSHLNWCKGQMDYLLGNNPYNTCFVTGFASNSSKNCHHRAASGYQGYDGDLGFHTGVKTYHPSNGKTLIGALAGGPSANVGYEDVIDNYETNEVAIDYNAGLVGAAAGLYHFTKSGKIDTAITGVDKIYNGSVTPQPSENPTDAPKPTENTTDAPKPTENTTDAQQPGGNADVKEMGENKWEINVSGASKLIVTATVDEKNVDAVGTIGYSAPGTEWTQKDWKVNTGSNGVITAECEVPSGVSTMQFQVWYPNTVKSVKAELVGGSTPQPTQASTQKPTDPPQNGNVKYGDVNCDGTVNVSDVIKLSKTLMGADSLSQQGRLNADVDCNNNVDSNDTNFIIKALVQLVTLPVK